MSLLHSMSMCRTSSSLAPVASLMFSTISLRLTSSPALPLCAAGACRGRARAAMAAHPRPLPAPRRLESGFHAAGLPSYREVLKGMGPLSLAAATDILESSKSCLVSQALCAPALSVWLNCRWPAEAPMHMQAPCRHATCPRLVALGAPCRAAPRRAAPHRKARGVCTCAAIVGGDMPRIVDEIPRRHAASILLLTEHTASQHLFARCQYSH